MAVLIHEKSQKNDLKLHIETGGKVEILEHQKLNPSKLKNLQEF